MVSSMRAVLMPASRGQLICRTKPGVDPQAEHSRKPSSMNSEKCANLRMICSDKGPRPELAQEAVYQCGNGLAAGRRDFACLHGIAEDKEDTGQQRRRKNNAERDEPGGCFLLLHSAPFM